MNRERRATGFGSRPFLAAAAVLILSATQEARSQLDLRVNRQVSAPGSIHDANPQVYGGPYNLPRSGFDSGAGANAIVTGSVTGLGAFHGDLPIVQNNLFRGALPTADLSDFNRRSVGLLNVRSGRPVGPSPFLDPQRTISDLGYIQNRINVPGSSAIRSPYVSPPNPAAWGVHRTAGTDAAESILDRLRSPVLRTPDFTSQRRWPDWTGLLPGPPTMSDGLDAASPRIGVAGLNTPITVDSVQSSRVAEADRVREPGLPMSGPAIASDAAANAADEGGGVGDDSPFPRQQPRITSLLTGPETDRRIPSFGDSDAQGLGGGELGSRRSRAQAAQDAPAAGGDRFADMLDAVRGFQQDGGIVTGSFSPSRGSRLLGETVTEGSSTADAGAQAPVSSRVPRIDESAVRSSAAAVKWGTNALDDPIRTFAGANEDTINRYLQKGESLLRVGQYYAAAGQFELAAVADPDNPLPLLGRGHALAAAGDYRTAVLCLERGIRRFPAIAAFRLDLPALVGDRDVFDRRRADLESRLQSSPDDHELRFLLGYLELYSGLKEPGLENLARAERTAPASSMISVFHGLVTGSRSIPASNPRGGPVIP